MHGLWEPGRGPGRYVAMASGQAYRSHGFLVLRFTMWCRIPVVAGRYSRRRGLVIWGRPCIARKMADVPGKKLNSLHAFGRRKITRTRTWMQKMHAVKDLRWITSSFWRPHTPLSPAFGSRDRVRLGCSRAKTMA